MPFYRRRHALEEFPRELLNERVVFSLGEMRRTRRTRAHDPAATHLCSSYWTKFSFVNVDVTRARDISFLFLSFAFAFCSLPPSSIHQLYLKLKPLFLRVNQLIKTYLSNTTSYKTTTRLRLIHSKEFSIFRSSILPNMATEEPTATKPTVRTNEILHLSFNQDFT